MNAELQAIELSAPAEEPAPEPRRASRTGLVALLVIFGAILVIALPNFLNAVQRGRQKRTMSDLRSIGTAVESYQVDNGGPPPVFGDRIAVSALIPKLVPTFIKELPEKDAWGNRIEWTSSGDEYSIYSPAADGREEHSLAVGATTSFSRDMYYSNGQFTVFPEGTMN